MPTGVSDKSPAFIRTAVPTVVAFLLTKYALPIDGVTANLVAQAVVGYFYYVLVHTVELKWPQFGYLLGIPKAPAYSTEPAPAPNGDEDLVAVVVPKEVDPAVVKAAVKKAARKGVQAAIANAPDRLPAKVPAKRVPVKKVPAKKAPAKRIAKN